MGGEREHHHHWNDGEVLVDNGDGTITDLRTGLMWEQAGSDTKYNHQGAMTRCHDLTLAGHADWRLPTVQELISIVDYERRGPAIDPTFKAAAFYYWSATSFTLPFNAWFVDFLGGNVFFDGKSLDFSVRAVRSGSLDPSTIRAENARLRAQLRQAVAVLGGLVSARDNAPAAVEERTVQSWRQARAFLADLSRAPLK